MAFGNEGEAARSTKHCSMKIVYIADFFEEEVHGGAEQNDSVLCDILSKEFEVEKFHSGEIFPWTISKIRKENVKFLISNFSYLAEDTKSELCKQSDFIIWEHDHKYCEGRNPGLFQDFLVPEDQKRNIEFYQKSLAIVCQSEFHRTILLKNVPNVENKTRNFSGSLWKEEDLDFLKFLQDKKKENCVAIYGSSSWNKGLTDAVSYCEGKKIPYKIIQEQRDQRRFWEELSSCKALIFFPKSPETLSRIVVEAKMMGMEVFGNDMIGAMKEPWWNNLSCDEIYDLMKNKKEQIYENFNCCS